MRGFGVQLGGIRGAALLAACVVLTSCGSATHGPATPPTTGQARPAGQAQPVYQDPPSGSKTEALHLAESLIAHVALPPGSVRLSGPVSAVFRAWASSTSIPDTALASGLWTTPASTRQVSTFTSAHPPTGTRLFAVAPIGVPGQPPIRVDDSLTVATAGIETGGVTVLIAPRRQGGSMVRAIATVRWYPPRSAAEHVPPGMRAVTISAMIGSARPRTISRTFTSPEVVSRLTGLLNAMNAAPSFADQSCAAVLTSYRLAFAATPAAHPALIATTGVCGGVAVVVRGTAQPVLADQNGAFTRAAASLLGVNPPF